MKKIKAGLVAAVVLAGFSGTAMAEGGNYYAALDVGQSTGKDACNGLPAGWSCKDTATAARIGLGYQASPSLGAEFSYGDYGEFKANGTASGLPAEAKVAGTGFQLSAIGSLPINESFALTAKLGAAFTKVEASGTGVSKVSSNTTTLAYGIGARYNINKSIALLAQYEDLGKVGDDATTGKSNLTLLTVGAIFGF